MKKYLTYFSLLIVTVLSVFIVTKGTTVLAFGSESISSDISSYNGIIFGDHTVYGADIEGSTAVQKDVYLNGGFSYAASGEGHTNILVGKPYLNSNTPGLLLGGKLLRNTKGELVISGGDLVHQPDSFNSVDKISFHNGMLKEISMAEMGVIFASFEQQVNNNLTLYEELISEGQEIAKLTNSTMPLYESTKNPKVLYVKMDKENLPTNHFRDGYIPNLDNYERIIFYSSAHTFKFSQGALLYDHQLINTNEPQSVLIDKLAKKITWVFPNANSLNIQSYGLIGDVYAPQATVEGSGGAINGALYTKNLIQKNGFELHNFNNEPLSEIPLTPLNPSEPNENEEEPGLPDEPVEEDNNEKEPLTPVEPTEPVEEDNDEKEPLTPVEPTEPIEEDKDEEKPLTPVEPTEPIEEDKDEEKPLTPVEPTEPIEEDKDEEKPLTPAEPTEPAGEDKEEEDKPEKPLNSEDLGKNNHGKGEQPIDSNKLKREQNKKMLPNTGESNSLTRSLIGLALLLFISSSVLNGKKNRTEGSKG